MLSTKVVDTFLWLCDWGTVKVKTVKIFLSASNSGRDTKTGSVLNVKKRGSSTVLFFCYCSTKKWPAACSDSRLLLLNVHNKISAKVSLELSHLKCNWFPSLPAVVYDSGFAATLGC